MEKANKQLSLFNTETKEKQPIIPLSGRHVKMYTCGPTVYDFAHIGNFRTYIFEDLLRRTIKFFGLKITHVMNITDVDDKTIRGATQEDISLQDYVKPYVEAFFDDLKTLGIEPAEHYPKATDFIPQMIDMIQVLLDKGFAYQGRDGSIYYDIHKFKRYGCLSHLKIKDLKTGASKRIAADEYDKDHVADFVLWKAFDPERDGKIYWESPYGKGRPGWHLECSCMAMQLLGETLDIHVGGVDNMFPHHENEIAQSEACSGKKFSRLWLHSEHLLVDGKKMSKSLGNFYTLRDLLKKGYDGNQIRYMLLQTHYKTQLNFTLSGLDAAKHSLDRMNNFIERLMSISEDQTEGAEKETFEIYTSQALDLFTDALSDDLNISVALSSIFDLIRDINTLCDEGKISFNQAREVLDLMKRFNQVLNVLIFEKKEEFPKEALEFLKERDKARKNKNWALADELRDKIHALGFEIEDTPTGSKLHG